MFFLIVAIEELSVMLIALDGQSDITLVSKTVVALSSGIFKCVIDMFNV